VAPAVGAAAKANPMPMAQTMASPFTSVRDGKPSLNSFMIFALPGKCCRIPGKRTGLLS
jgi:hypothetical protein